MYLSRGMKIQSSKQKKNGQRVEHGNAHGRASGTETGGGADEEKMKGKCKHVWIN